MSQNKKKRNIKMNWSKMENPVQINDYSGSEDIFPLF